MKINASIYWLKSPAEVAVREFLKNQAGEPFSYPEVGATRNTPPPGYQVDHHRIRLGSGMRTFEASKQCLKEWEIYRLGWVSLSPQDASFQTGQVVAIVVRFLGLWSLNPCRVVYVAETKDEIERFSCAVGTLPLHFENGEERFTVEWDRRDDSVWYDILAFSRTNRFCSRIASPYVRRLQKKFALDSMNAMRNAVNARMG